jgi:hypothetical protein
MKLQQAIIKRGGGVASALKRYQIMRKEEPSKLKPTIINANGNYSLLMNDLVSKVYPLSPPLDSLFTYLFIFILHYF